MSEPDKPKWGVSPVDFERLEWEIAIQRYLKLTKQAMEWKWNPKSKGAQDE